MFSLDAAPAFTTTSPWCKTAYVRSYANWRILNQGFFTFSRILRAHLDLQAREKEAWPEIFEKLNKSYAVVIIKFTDGMCKQQHG